MKCVEQKCMQEDLHNIVTERELRYLFPDVVIVNETRKYTKNLNSFMDEHTDKSLQKYRTF